MVLLSIDTDSKGAVCVVDYVNNTVEIKLIPRITSFEKEVVDGVVLHGILVDLFARYKVQRVVIERQHARTGQGVSSMFSFGRTYGTIITALRLAMPTECVLEYVTGSVWKGRMGLTHSKADMKEKALLILQDMGVSLKKFTIPMADAFMINLYAHQWGDQQDGENKKTTTSRATAKKRPRISKKDTAVCAVCRGKPLPDMRRYRKSVRRTGPRLY